MSAPARRSLVSVVAAVVLAGCGSAEPQAPLPEAKKLDESTSGISTACGLSYQVTAFPGQHEPDLSTLEATATTAANKLASVYARNPGWIYQGEPVHAIVTDSLTMLRQCGLSGAAQALTRRTGLH
jgi:multidrug efflux pump subunit AcrA (membrane-fusion protein)